MEVLSPVTNPADVTTKAYVDALVAGVSAGSVVATVVEVNLGSAAVRAGRFTITTTGLASGRPVHVVQVPGPYTGKGALADEAAMDQISVSASAVSATQIDCYWVATGPVRGNVKFAYYQI